MDNLELWYRANRGKFADGIPPVSFKSNGDALTNWTIYGHTSPNLLDISSIIPDSSIDFQTGEIVESDGTSVSDWIPISDTGLFFSGMLTTSDPSTSLIFFALYDDEKNLLDIQAIGWNEEGAKSHEITVVEGTSFLRLQLTDNVYQNVMINQGDSTLPYEPFGAVGDRTVNIMPSASEITTTSHGITVTCDGKGKYYISGTNDSNKWVYFFFNLKENFTIPVAVSRGGQGTFSFWNSTASANVIGFFNGSTTIDTWQLSTINRRGNAYGAMGGKICNRISINIVAGYSGNFVLSPDFTENGEYSSIFEPYGYKIPVTCGGETTNIYIGDTPLGTGQTVTGSETGVEILTVDGENTLSIGTNVQPSKVVISAASGMTESVKRYFDYKYGVLKMAGVKE